MAPFDSLPKVEMELPIAIHVNHQKTEGNLEVRKK
jgi:hypothetical protein